MTKPEIKCRTLPELKEELREMGEKQCFQAASR